MSKFRPKNPYQNRDKITPEDLAGKPYAIVTITTAAWVNMSPVDDDGEQVGEDYKLVLVYDEIPGKQHVLNRTSYRSLQVKLGGDDESKWVGQRVPVRVVETTDPRTGEEVSKVWIAGLKKYDEIMALDSKASKSRKGRA